jgi:hypothetical protein
MGTKQYSNALDLLTFSRASGGTSLRKISYGSELVENGEFTTDISGWFSGSGSGIPSWNSGALDVENDGTAFNMGVASQITLEIGKVYEISVQLTAESAGNSFFSVSSVLANKNTNSQFGDVFVEVGETKTTVFVATITAAYVHLIAQSTGISTFDNISVKEVLFDQPDGTLTLFNHPDNIPRIDYYYDGTVKGLLIEEQRTNLIQYSEDFTQSSWVKANTTVTSNAAVAPDGTSAADKLVENSATSGHLVLQPYTHSGQTMTFTMYAKASERSLVRLKYYDGSNHRYGAVFDLSDGTVVNDANTISGVLLSSSIEPVGEFYRIRISGSAPAGSGNFSASLATVKTSTTNPSESYTGDGTSGIYIWGAQLEEGSFPTSYIPNNGAPSGATRSADIASIPVTDFGYNTVGTIYVDGTFRNGDTIITVGSETIDADADGEKDYAQSYTSDPSASDISFDGGTYKTVRYYPRVLTASQISEMTG